VKLGLAVIAVASFAFVLSLASCGLFGGPGAQAPGLPADASAGQVTADQIVQDLTAAWNATSIVCLSEETAGALPKGSCASALLPVLDGIEVTASAVDAWDEDKQGSFPCALAAVTKAFAPVENLLQSAGVTVPAELLSAMTTAAGFAGGACPADGGAPAQGGG
jgi:hypothetical protein